MSSHTFRGGRKNIPILFEYVIFHMLVSRNFKWSVFDGQDWVQRDYRKYMFDFASPYVEYSVLDAYHKPSPFPPFPTAKWFLAAYVRDVWSRMDALLAAATSTHGSVLKTDSTKKICKKLQGLDANSASWTTNVGNEKGEILMSVLTSSEAVDALQPMAAGLMDKYREHHRSSIPTVIAAIRMASRSTGCCLLSGISA